MAIAERQRVIQVPRILVASSNEAFRQSWSACVDKVVEGATGGADALAKLQSKDWEEVLIDRRLHDLDVGEVVRLIHARHPHLLVRMVDSEAAAETGDQAAGVQIPPADGNAPEAVSSPERLESEALFPAVQQLFNPQESIVPCPELNPLPGMIGCGPGLAEVFRLAHLVGPRRTTVLVTGETGTGKELVAHGIHQISPRDKNPFVVVNCAAIPEQLLEAELFGYARGAFTGAVQSRLGRIQCAHGGTLFLDEVGELPLSMQAKLLRFLQDGEIQRLGSSDVFRVDVRLISATNVDLLRRVQDKQFRLDLYYRLAVFPLELPALRERSEDIPALAQHFLKALAEDADEAPKQLTNSAVTVLMRYAWPGNVRELQHSIERAYILSQNEPLLRASHFAFPGLVLSK